MKVLTEVTPLTVAVRQWHEPIVDPGNESSGTNPRAGKDPPPRWPDGVLIFDCETTTDRAQRLTFGWYRYARWQAGGTLETVAEGILHADDLPERDPAGYARLVAFNRNHLTDVNSRHGGITLISRRAFLKDVFWPALQADVHIVGYNLPFDLSRLAVDWGETRRKRKRSRKALPKPEVFTRGFSLTLWEYQDKTTGEWREHKYRPRIRIKHVDNKRAFIGLGPVRKRDRRDPQHGGRFLDLKTLAFALTNRGHSLDSACQAFEITEGKATPGQHGLITEDYIAYAWQDVKASLALLERLRVEFDRHPIHLQPDRAQSPASIAKAYLRAMGITPLLDREPVLSRSVLGQTMSAYFGGRTECRIRRVPVPILYVDFLSMYPTVNSLMGLWRFITAERITVVDATEDVQALLDRVTLDGCFDPVLWPHLTFYAQIVPDGDVLPVRAAYSSPSFTIGVNRLTADRPLWYAGPDLVASTVLTGKPPSILRAFRLVPSGILSTLRPVDLGGAVPIDPRRDDFFRFVIEERKRLKQAARNGEAVPDHLDPFLKVLANSGGYGIFAELNRQELPAEELVQVSVFGAREDPFTAKTNAPEMPGTTCYPPIAALITSAARLMLALLEREVTDQGGAYAFCDTDSMAIVGSEHGGLVPCPGGPERMEDGREAIQALSWADVDTIVDLFAALNPYDRCVVRGSVLEIEDINYDSESGERRQLWCYAISAKRYALFYLDSDGVPRVPNDGYSEHGLGHLLNPSDPGVEDREWIRTVWLGLISEAQGQAFEWPDWLDRPAMSRITASSPQVLRPLVGKPATTYDDAPKPFNFLITPHVMPLGHPVGIDPEHFHLVAPYTRDARQWSKLRWTDIYSGDSFAVTTRSQGLDERMARVQSYGDVIARYRTHPEPKSLGPDGTPCGKQTVGLLQRRSVTLRELVHIGKETNRLEDVEQGLVHDRDEVQLVFHEPQGDASLGLEAPPQTMCSSCGTPVTSTRAKHCSAACRQRAYRQRRRRSNSMTRCDAS